MPKKRKRRRNNIVNFRPSGRASRVRSATGIISVPYHWGSGLFYTFRTHYGLLTLAALAGVYAWFNLWEGAASKLDVGAIVGRASVIDGDTLAIRGRRIRLHGIDAPESRQVCQDGNARDYRCGQKAALALADKIARQNVFCYPRGTDRYGRTIASCELEGEDLNGWLVSQGWAVAYTRYSSKYVPRETIARLARHGMWAGTFESPEDWRHRRR